MLSAVFADLASESCLRCSNVFKGLFVLAAAVFALGLYLTAGLFSYRVKLPATIAERVHAEREDRLARARRAFKDELGELDREGILLLRKKASEAEVDTWVTKLVQYVAPAVGVGEAQRVMSNAGLPGSYTVEGMDPAVATNVNKRRTRIAELIARADELSFEESFDPQ